MHQTIISAEEAVKRLRGDGALVDVAVSPEGRPVNLPAEGVVPANIILRNVSMGSLRINGGNFQRICAQGLIVAGDLSLSGTEVGVLELTNSIVVGRIYLPSVRVKSMLNLVGLQALGGDRNQPLLRGWGV